MLPNFLSAVMDYVSQLSECHDRSYYPTLWVPWWITSPNFLSAMIDHVTKLQGNVIDHATQLLKFGNAIYHSTQKLGSMICPVTLKLGNVIYDGSRKVGLRDPSRHSESWVMWYITALRSWVAWSIQSPWSWVTCKKNVKKAKQRTKCTCAPPIGNSYFF